VYVVIDNLEGSAALGILTAAVIVGNAPSLSESVGLARVVSLGDGVRNVHEQITFIVKSFFFTFIGLMLSPPWSYLLIGVLFGFLLLGARAPMVWLSTLGAGLDKFQVKMVTVSMPRGMAAGVLATMPAYLGVGGTENLPPLVFAAVLTSILIFAFGFPIVRGRAAAAAVTAGTPPSGATVPADPAAAPAGVPPGDGAPVPAAIPGDASSPPAPAPAAGAAPPSPSPSPGPAWTPPAPPSVGGPPPPAGPPVAGPPVAGPPGVSSPPAEAPGSDGWAADVYPPSDPQPYSGGVEEVPVRTGETGRFPMPGGSSGSEP
jgi:potassium/hydrogen antiporter